VKPVSVMVVDDDPVALEAAASTLEEAGFQVFRRTGAFGTISEVRRLSPDVLLLDVGLPGLSGDTLAQLLARDGAATWVVFHSSRTERELDELCRSSGALGAIRKSYEPGALVRSLRRLLAAAGRTARGAGS